MTKHTGFGLAHLKAEGAPCHPDHFVTHVYAEGEVRSGVDVSGQKITQADYDTWYERQLNAYNNHYGSQLKD